MQKSTNASDTRDNKRDKCRILPAIRHYAHNYLRRDRNKLVTDVYIYSLNTWCRSSPVIDYAYSAAVNTFRQAFNDVRRKTGFECSEVIFHGNDFAGIWLFPSYFSGERWRGKNNQRTIYRKWKKKLNLFFDWKKAVSNSAAAYIACVTKFFFQ